MLSFITFWKTTFLIKFASLKIENDISFFFSIETVYK